MLRAISARIQAYFAQKKTVCIVVTTSQNASTVPGFGIIRRKQKSSVQILPIDKSCQMLYNICTD